MEQLYQKIIAKFLTEKEIEEFERLIQMGPMIVIGNPMANNMLGASGPIDTQMMGGPMQRRLRY